MRLWERANITSDRQPLAFVPASHSAESKNMKREAGTLDCVILGYFRLFAGLTSIARNYWKAGRGNNVTWEHLTPWGVECYQSKKGNSMRRSMIAISLIASTIPAMAQTNMKPASHDANTPAVNSPNGPPNPGAPVAGANSFTEGQAKSRIEGKGFKSVSNLKKDDAGIWRGQAMQNDKTVNVSVDFQGNVVAQ
jgi:hypothetical protein